MFGKSLPTVVGYFVALLVTKILAGLPMVLLRSGKYSFLFQRIFPVKCWVFVLITSEFLVYTPKGALVRLIFLRTIFTKKFLSQREIDEVYRPQYLLYGWEVSYDYIFPTYFVVGNSFLKIKIYIIFAVSYAAISYCYLFYLYMHISSNSSSRCNLLWLCIHSLQKANNVFIYS